MELSSKINGTNGQRRDNDSARTIHIFNTKHQLLAQWTPENDECTTVDLMDFIESSLQIPSKYQVFYHDEKVLVHSDRMDSIKDDKELVLAYTNYPTRARGEYISPSMPQNVKTTSI